jgi:hypothetical protein
MKTQLIAALLVAVSTSVATSAFASSRYPAPQAGASVSQRDLSAAVFTTEPRAATNTQLANGRVAADHSPSHNTEMIAMEAGLYSHH